VDYVVVRVKLLLRSARFLGVPYIAAILTAKSAEVGLKPDANVRNNRATTL